MNKMLEYISDSSGDELTDVDENVINDNTEGSKFENIFYPDTLNDVDSFYKFSSRKVDDCINNACTEKWNHIRKVQNSLKRKYMEKRQHVPRQEYLSTVNYGEHDYNVGQKFTNKPDTVPSSTTSKAKTKLTQNLKSENKNAIDYFDKSESDEEGNHTIIPVQTDIADYVHVPVYDMENIFFENTSKFLRCSIVVVK